MQEADPPQGPRIGIPVAEGHPGQIGGATVEGLRNFDYRTQVSHGFVARFLAQGNGVVRGKCRSRPGRRLHAR